MKPSGFHLIEILIVMTLISLMASITFPYYSDYLIKERRFEASMMLTKLALALEEYHFEHLSYQGATLRLLHFPDYIVHHYYQLAIKASENTFLISAKPIAIQAKRDEQCGTLLLTAEGEKKITGNDKITECWKF